MPRANLLASGALRVALAVKGVSRGIPRGRLLHVGGKRRTWILSASNERALKSSVTLMGRDIHMCKENLRSRSLFSTAATSSPESPTFFSSEAEYDLAAEKFLEDLTTSLEDLDEFFQDFDLDYAQGVLTMKLGDGYGTYVLNKQRPNKQIWWSSPISGPKRFEFDGDSHSWMSSRHKEQLLPLLQAELLELNSAVKGFTLC